MTTILEDLGIRGIPVWQEYGVLSALLTGDPVLLVGAPGTAKSELVAQIAQALREYSRTQSEDPSKWFTHVSYDCSKLNPEDLIGFLNLAKLGPDGQPELIETSSTIWNKWLVSFDEFNRMDPDRQANLFEIIRSRRCLGRPTGTKFIINCMNPKGDEGTLPLSDALIDRHALYLLVEPFNEMKPQDRSYIIDRRGASDSVSLRFWNPELVSEFAVRDDSINPRLAAAGERISKLLKLAARDQLPRVEDRFGGYLTRLISRLATHVKPKDDWIISGRRAAMMRTACLSMLALSRADAELQGQSLLSRREVVANTLLASLPLCLGHIQPEEVQTIRGQVLEAVELQQVEEASSDPEIQLDELWETHNVIDQLRTLVSLDLSILERTKLWESVPKTRHTGPLIRLLHALTDQVPKEILDSLPSQPPSQRTIHPEDDLHPVASLLKQRYESGNPVESLFLNYLLAHYRSSSTNSLSQADKCFQVLQGAQLIQDLMAKHQAAEEAEPACT